MVNDIESINQVKQFINGTDIIVSKSSYSKNVRLKIQWIFFEISQRIDTDVFYYYLEIDSIFPI